jgi:hypothetical protein
VVYFLSIVDPAASLVAFLCVQMDSVGQNPCNVAAECPQMSCSHGCLLNYYRTSVLGRLAGAAEVLIQLRGLSSGIIPKCTARLSGRGSGTLSGAVNALR